MVEENRLGNLGSYLLVGSIFLRAEAYAQENSQKSGKLNSVDPFARVTSINTESAKDLTYSSPAILDSSDVTQNDTTKSKSLYTQKRKTLQNRIYSGNPEFSVVGEGVVLKDFVYNITLNPNSKIELDKFLDLYAKRGEISYVAVDAKKGLKNIISFLKKDLKSRDAQSQKERIATIKYYENLLEEISQNARSSLNKLEKAVGDGVIDVQKDSLMTNGIWQIKDGKYIIISKNKKTDWYVANSVPVIVDIKTSKGKIGSEGVALTTIKSEQKSTKDTLKISESYRDSTTIREERKVSTEKRIRKKVNPEVYAPPIKKEEAKENYEEICEIKEELRTRFGIDAEIGTNGEKVVGTSVGIPLSSWLRIGGFNNIYLNYFTSKNKGPPIFSNTETEVIARERRLIGSNIYKQRTDETTTNIEEKAIADLGGEITLVVGNFEFPFRVGTVLSRQEKTLEGKSTITHERDGQLIEEPSVIKNSKYEKPSSALNKSLSAGARFNINKHLSVGGSFNRIGQKNSIMANMGYKF